jgi:hypothetical protein
MIREERVPSEPATRRFYDLSVYEVIILVFIYLSTSGVPLPSKDTRLYPRSTSGSGNKSRFISSYTYTAALNAIRHSVAKDKYATVLIPK